MTPSEAKKIVKKDARTPYETVAFAKAQGFLDGRASLETVVRELIQFVSGEDCFCFEEENGEKCKRCEILSRAQKELGESK